MSVHIVNYASGRFVQAQQLQNAKWREYHPGLDLTIHSFDKNTLPRTHITDDIAKVLAVPQGDGLWAWKQLCIAHVFERANPGDIVFYMDSGAHPTQSQEWIFSEIGQHGQIFLKTSGADDEKITREWLLTLSGLADKRDLISQPDLFLARKWDKRLTQYPPGAIQVCGGFQGYRVSAKNAQFLEDLRGMISLANYDDTSGIQHEGFISHRHDQAVLTEMVYKYQLHIVDKLPGINLHRAN